MFFFQENCRDIEELPWFESLMFFGFEEGESVDAEDDDVKLLPAVVEKTILPKLACTSPCSVKCDGFLWQKTRNLSLK